VKQRTEIVIILVLVIHIGGPVLPNTFDLEDGFLVCGTIEIDTLESKFMNDAGANIEMPTVKWLKPHLKALYWRCMILVRFCIIAGAGGSNTLSFLAPKVNLVQPFRRY